MSLKVCVWTIFIFLCLQAAEERYEEELHQKDVEVHQKDVEIHQKDAKIQQKNVEIQQKNVSRIMH